MPTSLVRERKMPHEPVQMRGGRGKRRRLIRLVSGTIRLRSCTVSRPSYRLAHLRPGPSGSAFSWQPFYWALSRRARSVLERHFHLTAVNVLGENPLKYYFTAESVDGQSSRAGDCRRPGNLTASRRRSGDTRAPTRSDPSSLIILLVIGVAVCHRGPAARTSGTPTARRASLDVSPPRRQSGSECRDRTLRVHHFLRSIRETLIQAWVRANGSGGGSGLVDLEIQLVRVEEELQRGDYRARQAIGARRVVRIGRGLGSSREVQRSR